MSQRGTDGGDLLTVEDLRTHFFTQDGVVKAVDGISFGIRNGETLGIVGESGCGKSITALSVMRLIERPGRIVEGSIRLAGRDLLAMSDEEMRDVRGNASLDDLPGADDLAQPGLHVRRPDRGGDLAARGDSAARGEGSGRGDARARSGSPTRSAGPASIRTSSRAGCASGS